MQHFDIRRNKRRYAPILDLGTFRTRKTLSPRVPTRLVPRMRGSCLSRDTHGLPVPVDGCDCYLVNRGRVVPLPRGISATEKRGKASRTFVHVLVCGIRSFSRRKNIRRIYLFLFPTENLCTFWILQYQNLCGICGFYGKGLVHEITSLW